MVSSRNVVNKRKKSVKTLRGTIEKKTKLKSNAKSEKIKKQKAKKFIETAEVIPNTENVVTKKLKASKKDLITKTKNEVEKTVSQKSKKKIVVSKKASNSVLESGTNNLDVEKAKKVKPRVGKSLKKASQDGENSKKINRVSTNTLKANVTKSKLQNIPKIKESISTGKAANLRKRKIEKKKRVNAKESDVTIDNLDLKDLSKEHILQCITAIFHLTQEQLKSKNALFDGDSQPVFMQVTCIRVPKTPRRQMRILLPYSIATPNDDIALFVCDLQRGRRKDYEPTVDYYQDLLRKHGCTRVKTIIPMNQVKTEYDQFELKRKLVSSYDYFLVDGRIAGHISHLLGKEFFKKRKLPTSIRMQSKDLKHEIQYALKKTTMHLHSFGDTHTVQIGHTSMTAKKMLNNILAACKSLSKNYPGGWNNIRSVSIKTATSLSLPIYVTLKSKNSVNVPVVKPKRPKAYQDVEGELSTVYGNASVTVTPEGNITVNKEEDEEEEVIQESDV